MNNQLDLHVKNAVDAFDNIYGLENQVLLNTGASIMYSPSSGYMRLVSPAGCEVVYWSMDEWKEAPEEIMGAMLILASRSRQEWLTFQREVQHEMGTDETPTIHGMPHIFNLDEFFVDHAVERNRQIGSVYAGEYFTEASSGAKVGYCVTAEGADYVRILSPNMEHEVMCWDKSEWGEDPEQMFCILHILSLPASEWEVFNAAVNNKKQENNMGLTKLKIARDTGIFTQGNIQKSIFCDPSQIEKISSCRLDIFSLLSEIKGTPDAPPMVASCYAEERVKKQFSPKALSEKLGHPVTDAMYQNFVKDAAQAYLEHLLDAEQETIDRSVSDAYDKHIANPATRDEMIAALPSIADTEKRRAVHALTETLYQKWEDSHDYNKETVLADIRDVVTQLQKWHDNLSHVLIE